MVERKAFLANPKHECHVSQSREHDCSAHNKKNGEHNELSNFVISHGWTLFIRKMVGKKAFLANWKDQYCVSQYREHDCSAHNERNGDYNNIQVCLISRVNINYEENGGKKSFCCKPKGSISCIPMQRKGL